MLARMVITHLTNHDKSHKIMRERKNHQGCKISRQDPTKMLILSDKPLCIYAIVPLEKYVKKGIEIWIRVDVISTIQK